MPSIFMGPYPTRFTRAPTVLATRPHSCGLTSGSTAALPALKTLYSIRSYGAAAAAATTTRTTASSHHAATSAAAAAASIGYHGQHSTTQLATLPTTLVTQVTQWRQTRTCCTSATLPGSSTPGLVEPPTHVTRNGCGGSSSAANGARRSRRRSSLQWSALPEALTRSAVEQHLSSSLIDGAALAALFESPAEAMAGGAPFSCADGVLERVASAATAAGASPSSTTNAASAVNEAVGASLHTARRHYGSTAANADGNSGAPEDEDPSSGQKRDRNGNPAADETPPEDAAATFEDVCAAFRTLGLLGPDGCVVRTWTASDIKRAYRTLAKELHPDVAGGGSGAQMERVNSAYDLLCDMSDEAADNYRVWLEMGGEAEMWACDTPLVRRLLRWTSRDVVQFVAVGWCTTFSGLALYAGWSMLYGTPGKVNVSSASATHAAGAGRAASLRAGEAGGRLTLLRAGTALSSAPGVHYGVISPGGSLFASAAVPQWCVQLVRTAVSRYALAVALTVAACVNTVMVQRVVLRLLTGSA